MAFKLHIAPKLKFKVRGTMKDESGTDQPFDFTLTAQRLDADTIRARLKDDAEASLADFLATVLEDWQGIKDADDQPLPFTDANLRAVCKVPGLAPLMFQTYFAEVGAKAKN